tara:strand:+ start:28968 stop:30092 length:1125 start_codon:yes stop_codon:yes gene_type:complete
MQNKKQNKIVNFEIDNIDPLGQGVSKIDNKIVFIPKTLPGEKGQATITKKKGKVFFAEANKIETAAEKRIEAECPHYDQCSGCSFLHTDYESELNFKKITLERAFAQLTPTQVQVIGAKERFHYRNRVQLHYHKNSKTIGQHKRMSHYIVETKNCLLGTPEVQEKLQEVYDENFWSKLSNQPPTGHLEIYKDGESASISYNQNYATGGFTQVNEQMNIELNEYIFQIMNSAEPKNCVELFGGNGNISRKFKEQNPDFKRILIDIYPHQISSDDDLFLNLNIYKTEISEFKSSLSKSFSKIDCLIIDPPRSGYKELVNFLREFEPKEIIYVSCDHQTLRRDLSQVEGYEFKSITLIDLFPSTHHFETVIHLVKKQ